MLNGESKMEWRTLPKSREGNSIEFLTYPAMVASNFKQAMYMMDQHSVDPFEFTIIINF